MSRRNDGLPQVRASYDTSHDADGNKIVKTPLIGRLTDSESATPKEDYQHHVDAREEAVASISALKEASFDTEQVKVLAKSSLDFLAGLAAPSIFKFCFPPVFISVWLWLTTYVAKPQDFSQLALGLPRGFAKTTVIKLFILYCILFTKKRFILVVSATSTLAENILADVMDMLSEPNIKVVFGDWSLGIEKDTQAVKTFGFRGRTITLAAIGAGTALRGLNIKQVRPDVMIFEDVQTREQADSPVLSDNLEKWIVGTAMKAKSPEGCLYIFVANMYPTKFSILRKLKTNPTWVKFIAGAILSDGTSLWEQLHPIARLLEEFKNDMEMGRPEIFYSEVLNDENAANNNLLDFSKIPDFPVQEGDICAANYILVDPSNKKDTADKVAICYFEVHDGVPCMMDLVNERLSPSETIREALRLATTYNCRLICVESVAYQATLCYWFGFICNQLGIIGIEVVEIYPGKMGKNARILALFKQLMAGEVRIHPRLMPEISIQVHAFNPLKIDNEDDLLDMAAYSTKALELYGDYARSLGVIESQEIDASVVYDFNSPF